MMRKWISELLSYVDLWLPGRSRHRAIVALFLLIDAILLAAFLRWAYVEHYHITSSVMFGDLRYSMVDGSLVELFGYFKETVIVLLLGAAFFYRRKLVYAGFALLFLMTLLDDSLSLHERLGHWVSRLPPLLGVPQDISEIMVFALLGLVPLILVAIGYLHCYGRDRRNAEALGLGFGALLFCAEVMDFIHGKVVEAYGKGDTVFSLLEDGGELLSMTLITAIALRVLQLTRDKPAFA
jgi:hypothetical protein